MQDAEEAMLRSYAARQILLWIRRNSGKFNTDNLYLNRPDSNRMKY